MAEPQLIIAMDRFQEPPPTIESSTKAPSSNGVKNGAPNGIKSGVTDGRLHRSMSTRRKIVTALETLIRAGTLSPTAEQVAVQAQVGLRTVFRHFDDMETLYREISVDLDAISIPLLKTRLQSATWESRLIESIELRAQIFEELTPFFLSSSMHRHQSNFIQEQSIRSAQSQRSVLEKILPDHVRNQPWLVDAFDLILSIDAWVRLRRDQGLSREQAMRVMQNSAQALIAKN